MATERKKGRKWKKNKINTTTTLLVTTPVMAELDLEQATFDLELVAVLDLELVTIFDLEMGAAA